MIDPSPGQTWFDGHVLVDVIVVEVSATMIKVRDGIMLGQMSRAVFLERFSLVSGPPIAGAWAGSPVLVRRVDDGKTFSGRATVRAYLDGTWTVDRIDGTPAHVNQAKDQQAACDAADAYIREHAAALGYGLPTGGK